MNKQIGLNLRQARIKAKKTQQQMADIIGVSVQQYQHYEYGTQRLHVDKLVKICLSLDILCTDICTLK